MRKLRGPIWKGPVPGATPPRTKAERDKLLYGLPKGDLTPRQKWVVAGFAFLGVLFLVAVTLFSLKPPPRQVRIVLTGTPGLRLKVSSEADGRQHHSVVRVPTNFLFAAHDLDFTFKRISAGGEVALAVFIEGKQRSLVTSMEPAGGAFVEIHHGLFKKRYGTGTFELSR
ncbi:MAG: hypothetical protein FJ386_14395 [Verrucomicrobia bacterium]|nr:hypothetical protein [Verrucomicrobiota bacterium]